MEHIMNRIPAHDPLDFGVTALKLMTHRHELLSANLVNADTPHFKARDIDFAGELRNNWLDGLHRSIWAWPPRTQVICVGAGIRRWTPWPCIEFPYSPRWMETRWIRIWSAGIS
jgi:hypothetical protein